VTPHAVDATPADERFRRLVGDVRVALLWAFVIAMSFTVDGRPVLAPVAALLLLRAARTLERADLAPRAVARARAGRIAAVVGVAAACTVWIPSTGRASAVVTVAIADVVLAALAACLLAEADRQDWPRSARRWRAAARWCAAAAGGWVAFGVVAAITGGVEPGPALFEPHGWALVASVPVVVVEVGALLLWAGVPMGWSRAGVSPVPRP
jgi:hypothetical protein